MHTNATSMFFSEAISGVPSVSPEMYKRFPPYVNT